jgi:hypothetical protein
LCSVKWTSITSLKQVVEDKADAETAGCVDCLMQIWMREQRPR